MQSTRSYFDERHAVLWFVRGQMSQSYKLDIFEPLISTGKDHLW